MIRVLVVDDQDLVRAGFRMILQAEPDIAVVGEAADGQAAVDLVAELDPDVVLMDVRMPRMSGLEATRRLTELGCTARVLVLTTFDLDEYVFEALRGGAAGFLLKTTPADQLINGIRAVAAGDGLLAPSVTRRLIEQFARQPAVPDTRATGTLTTRELEVLTLLARGLNNSEIASSLHIEASTVKSHVANILGKLGLRDRTQAVVLAYESGLIRPTGS
ncbi:MAG: response regulator transcription factor [Candidatus Nanopelagicales bacterium]|nr:response regulator transcription factor [Candidatus Nanopelagicales bacterium]